MLWSDVITLLTPKSEPAAFVDANGFKVAPKYDRRTIYCSKKSVGNAEYYRAAQQGQSVRFKFDVYTAEYTGERLAEYAGVIYNILRTYELYNGEITELTVSDLAT